jgi:hypothetical protein
MGETASQFTQGDIDKWLNMQAAATAQQKVLGEESKVGAKEMKKIQEEELKVLREQFDFGSGFEYEEAASAMAEALARRSHPSATVAAQNVARTKITPPTEYKGPAKTTIDEEAISRGVVDGLKTSSLNVHIASFHMPSVVAAVAAGTCQCLSTILTDETIKKMNAAGMPIGKPVIDPRTYQRGIGKYIEERTKEAEEKKEEEKKKGEVETRDKRISPDIDLNTGLPIIRHDPTPTKTLDKWISRAELPDREPVKVPQWPEVPRQRPLPSANVNMAPVVTGQQQLQQIISDLNVQNVDPATIAEIKEGLRKMVLEVVANATGAGTPTAEPGQAPAGGGTINQGLVETTGEVNFIHTLRTDQSALGGLPDNVREMIEMKIQSLQNAITEISKRVAAGEGVGIAPPEIIE